MTSKEVAELDRDKSRDKEWQLLRREGNVVIKTIDDLIGLPNDLKLAFEEIKYSALKGESVKKWNSCAKELHELIKSGKVKVK